MGVECVVFSRWDEGCVGGRRRRGEAVDVESGEILRSLEGHSDWVYSVAFSPDGAKIASGSVDRSVKLWDVESGEVIHSLEGHSDHVLSVSFSPDGTKVASGSYGIVKLWDVESGEVIRTLRGHAD